MNKFLSLSVIPLAATATVASVMMASAPAQAIVLTLGEFISDTDGIEVGDKIFTFSSTTLTNPEDTIEIAYEGLNYALFYNFETAFTGSSFDFKYNVTTLGNSIIGVGLDSDVAFSGLKTVTTDFNGTTLVSTGGSPEGSPLFPATSVDVANAYTSAGGRISSFSNTFEQVPEPLTILGTGLALGFGGLFKSKSSKKQSVKA